MKEVLILWEDAVGIQILREVLKKADMNVNVTSTYDGFQAFHIMEKKGCDFYSLIVVGSHVLSLNPLEFVILCRSKWAKESLPIFYISANVLSDNAEEKKEAFEAGVNEFCIKSEKNQISKTLSSLLK